jgi:hypothetical protein
VGHAEAGAADKSEDLAKRRADAVKWYLVDQGIAADQIATELSPFASKTPVGENAIIELRIAVAPLPAQ